MTIFYDGDSLARPLAGPGGLVAREGDGAYVDPSEPQPMLPGVVLAWLSAPLPTYVIMVEADWADWIECMYVDPTERGE